MIFDSNLVIYSTLPGYAQLRRLIADARPAVSAVSRVEVLGYHKITPTEKQQLEATFAALEVLPVTDAVIARTVLLRQSRKMSLGDALIAATANSGGARVEDAQPQGLRGDTGPRRLRPARGERPGLVHVRPPGYLA